MTAQKQRSWRLAPASCGGQEPLLTALGGRGALEGSGGHTLVIHRPSKGWEVQRDLTSRLGLIPPTPDPAVGKEVGGQLRGRKVEPEG